MNLREQTIEQKQAAVALMPELDKRFNTLRALLNECCEKDVDLWRIDLAVADLDAVLSVMTIRIVDSEDD